MPFSQEIAQMTNHIISNFLWNSMLKSMDSGPRGSGLKRTEAIQLGTLQNHINRVTNCVQCSLCGARRIWRVSHS